MLIILIGVSTWLQFVVVTDLNGQMLTFYGVALWRGVLFTDESRFSLYRADGRQFVWRRVGERFADVNVVDRVAHGGGGLMVWASVCCGQRTQVHFIDGILNAQRYREEILRPIVMPFIHDHHLMLQHDNARPHVARICTQFLEAESIPVLAWPAYSPDMSPTEYVWDALDRRIRQRVPVSPISSNFAQPLKRSGPTFHRPQSTTWSTLCEGDVLQCVRQMVVTPDTDWFSDLPGLHILEWPFIAASLRHTCAIIMLSNQHLDIYLGKGEVLRSVTSKHRFRQICEQYLREICVLRKCLRYLSSAHEKWGKN